MRAAAAWAKQRLEATASRTSRSRPGARSAVAGSTSASSRMMTAPQPFPLLAFPKAWTPGTNGPVKGEAVLAVIEKAEDLAKWKGKLKGKFVLVSPTRDGAGLTSSRRRAATTRRGSPICEAVDGSDAARPLRRRAGPAGPAQPPTSASSAWRSSSRKACWRWSRCRPAIAATTAPCACRRRPRARTSGRRPTRRCCRRSSSPASTTAGCCGCSTRRSRWRSRSTSRTASSTPSSTCST